MTMDFKCISLTGGGYAIVDREDYDYLVRWKWKNKNGYATRNALVAGKWRELRMHRVVLGVYDDMWVDHINFDRLDNRKSNLRAATPSQNAMNRRVQVVNTSGYKGVIWHKKQQKWNAVIEVNGKKNYVGAFTDKEEAARAYNEAALKLFGEFACLNTVSNAH